MAGTGISFIFVYSATVSAFFNSMISVVPPKVFPFSCGPWHGFRRLFHVCRCQCAESGYPMGIGGGKLDILCLFSSLATWPLLPFASLIS
jgi:hypothetical protein